MKVYFIHIFICRLNLWKNAESHWVSQQQQARQDMHVIWYDGQGRCGVRPIKGWAPPRPHQGVGRHADELTLALFHKLADELILSITYEKRSSHTLCTHVKVTYTTYCGVLLIATLYIRDKLNLIQDYYTKRPTCVEFLVYWWMPTFIKKITRWYWNLSI